MRERVAADKILTMELVPEGAGDLRLEHFLEQMAALRVALRETERVVYGREPSVFLKIKRLQKNSPAFIEMEADTEEPQPPRQDYPAYVVHSLTTNLTVIGGRHRPRRIDVSTLSAYEELTQPLVKHGLRAVVRTASHVVDINQDFRQAIREVIGDDETAYGSVTGRIEAMTTHSRNTFRLYPVVGAKRIIGQFSSRDRTRFSAGMDRYVTVWGTLKYKTWDRFPYEINADDIEVHEKPSVSLVDLKGLAPGATGDLTTQEFINALRDE